MWSRYLKIRQRDGIVAIFHELHPDPVYCTHEQWDRVMSGDFEGSDEILWNLQQRKLLVESTLADDEERDAVAEALERKLSRPGILYLMTAQGCNFNCGYCMVPEIARKFGASLLSKTDAEQGIDLWQRHIVDAGDPEAENYIIFYGGEPLLNKETIEHSLRYAAAKIGNGQMSPKTRFMIATNGSLVDDRIVDLCKEFDVMVAIGLDGPKSANDAYKVDDAGEGTCDRVIAAIKLLVSSGVKTFASVSITPANIDSIGQYGAFFKGLGIEKFGFNLLKGKALVELIGKGGVEGYGHLASKGIIDLARKSEFQGFEYQMEKKRLAFEKRDFYPVDCTCYGNQLVIQPDGQISNCPFHKAWLGHIGSVDHGFRIWNQPIVMKWRKRLSLDREGHAKALCGGGCAWSSLELTGNPLAEDHITRMFSEEVLDELIWSRYESSKP